MFDVIVVGGGHAGIEASLAPARLGFRVALITLDVNYVGSVYLSSWFVVRIKSGTKTSSWSLSRFVVVGNSNW